MARWVLCSCLFAAGCADDRPVDRDAGAGADAEVDAGAAADASVATGATDVLSTTLELDLGALRGAARIEVVPASQGLVTLEVGDLAVDAVTRDGAPVAWASWSGVLDVEVGAATEPVILDVRYAFSTHGAFDGYMPAGGLTFLFPESCGNLFPCRSEPGDGMTFRLLVQGAPPGEVLVHATEIETPAPSYMLAFAHGPFVETVLGTTAAGTVVEVWHAPGLEADAAVGTARLVEVFDLYEQRLGPYPFGPRAGSVSAAWGSEARGGMEHHPFWHVAEADFGNPVTHAHEAAHGWFGNGVRMRCWEDFVLSEGVVTYLVAHALEALDPAAADAEWARIEAELADLAGRGLDTVAWPEGCGRIEIRDHPVLSPIPYDKGAMFLRSVRDAIGAEALDLALADFFRAHVGTAAGMGDLVESLRGTGIDAAVLEGLVAGWLRGLGTP